MFHKFILLFALQFVAHSAFAWVVKADFENGTVGELANGADAFTYAHSATKITTERVKSGSKAVKATIQQGDDGFGDFGGEINFPAPLGEGDEVWYRVWVYYPNGFTLNCSCPEGIKFLRLRTFFPDNTFAGSWDYYLRDGGAVMATGLGPQIQDIFYVQNHPWPHTDIRDIGGAITKGVWHAYEHYIKFSATRGQGIIRAWLDGNLIFEDRDTPTLRAANHTVKQATLWTYWNNLAPQTQSAYVDDIVLSSEEPDARDAHGNAFIGVGNTAAVTFTSSPLPPANISVSPSGQ